MKSIRLINLRSIGDSGPIELKPINLVVGQNSSGKSTFVRCFPLIRQSVEVRGTSPVLWYGRYVDFGSINDAIKKNSTDRFVAFEFQFNWNPARELFPRRINLDKKSNSRDEILVKIRIEIAPSGESEESHGQLQMALINIGGQVVQMLFDSKGRVRILVNEIELVGEEDNAYARQGEGLLPLILFKENSKGALLQLSESLLQRIMSRIEVEHPKLTSEDVAIFANSFESFTIEGFKKELEAFGKGKKQKQEAMALDAAQELLDLMIAFRIPRFVRSLNQSLTEFFLSVRYTGPQRVVTDRFYRIQSLAVDEVDHQGINIAQLLHSFPSHQLNEFREWTMENLGFEVSTLASTGHISLRLKLSIDGIEEEFNLVDMGFGFSQILPLVTQMWLSLIRSNLNPIRFSTNPIIVIEQPELHLHPKFQAKFAETLFKVVGAAIKSGINPIMVIETHSSEIIERIGFLLSQVSEDSPRGLATDVDRNQVSAKDVQVLLFSKSNQGTDIQTAGYDEDGNLTNWPYGFFDSE